MTTNGLVLKRMAKDLKDLGMDQVNVSLDTLEPGKFELIARRRGFEKVVDSIDEALKVGFGSVKVNMVVMRDINHLEVNDFVELTKFKKLTVRFIEYMPFDGNKWNFKKMVPYKELLEIIKGKYSNIAKLVDDPNDTSKGYKVEGYQGDFGVISSMSDHFCGSCNRVRITADGNLKVCLFGPNEVSLRDIIRSDPKELKSGLGDDNQNANQSTFAESSFSPDQQQRLLEAIQQALSRKKAKHAGMFELSKTKNRPMILIGG